MRSTGTTSADDRPHLARAGARERADEYEAYYMHELPQLVRAALGVQTLREQRGDEVEFVTISYWEDIAAMSRFAGDDPRRIHHLDRDAELLVERRRALIAPGRTASSAPGTGVVRTSGVVHGAHPRSSTRSTRRDTWPSPTAVEGDAWSCGSGS